MQVIVKGSLYRDWKEIRNRKLSKILLQKIEEVESVESISQISHLKKLRIYKSRYRLEIKTGRKVYWVLCVARKNKIELLRLKPESYFKKKL